MHEKTNEIQISFKYGYTEIDEYEMPLKGYRNDIIVECPDGNKYELCFYDSGRLSQDIIDEEFIVDPGLIVVKEVNKENIKKAAQYMWDCGLFTKFKSL